MNVRIKMAAALAALAFTFTAAVVARAADSDIAQAKNSGAVTMFVGIPQDPGTVALLPQGKSTPLVLSVPASTTMAGICDDCHMFQKFKSADAGKSCNMCGCASANAVCVAWSPLKKATWQNMLTSLPRGMALRVTYNEADKPESGLKTLTIDHRTVLLPVQGLADRTPDQLNAMVKPFGGAKAQLVGEGGTQLLIDMSEDWTADRSAKFLKALEKAGAKVVMPEIKTPEPAK